MELGPESTRLPLTLYTTKRCPHRDRSSALGTDWTATAFRSLQRSNPLLQKPLPFCISIHLCVHPSSLSLCLYSFLHSCVPTCSCLSIQPYLSARTHTHPSFHPSIHPSAHRSICLCSYVPTHLPTCSCLSIQPCLSAHTHAHAPVHPSIHPSTHLPICLFVYVAMYLPITHYQPVHVCPFSHVSLHTRTHAHPSFHPPIHLPICLFVYVAMYLPITHLPTCSCLSIQPSRTVIITSK
jgi:hypothetical protein